MSCALEFPESSLVVEFCNKGTKQKILIDILTKYSELDRMKLASLLGVSEKKLNDIAEGHDFFIEEQADNLAQLFLMFFGKLFFRRGIFTRNF